MNKIHTQDEIKHSNKMMKIASGLTAVAAVFIAIAIVLTITTPGPDTVKYEGNKYSVLGYPADIFMYDLAEYVECAEDETVPLDGSQWRMVYNNCDVYCHIDDFNDANAYYNNHENYDWYVNIEYEDSEKMYPINPSVEDFEYIYRMEDMNKETSMFFDEIEMQGSLIKVSKDGFIEGRTGLALYEGSWYWRTEIIDESREVDGDWPEYVIPLPAAVSDEIMESGDQ